MKVYSNDAVTRDIIDAVDTKQTKQIEKLRMWLAASFLVNAIFTVVMHYL